MNKLHRWWVESKTWQHVLLGIGLVVGLYLLAVLGVRIANKGKILPGVSARGIDVGGLTKEQAVSKLDVATNVYLGGKSSYGVDGKLYQISPAEIGVSYDNKAMVEELYKLGRSGNILSDIATQTALPFTAEDMMQVNIDGVLYSTAMVSLNNQIALPSQNAQYVLGGAGLEVTPEKSGRRLNMGLAMLNLTRQFSELRPVIDLPIEAVSPDQTSENLLLQKDRVSKLVNAPLKLNYADKAWDISTNQILQWLSASNHYIPQQPNLLTSLIRINQNYSDLELNKNSIKNFLGPLAGEINIEAIDAQLSIADGRATVFKQSRDGKTLNVEASSNSIISALASGQNRSVDLAVDTRKAEVNDGNIDKLGIKELIGEGVSYFPGSSWQRLQNIRVGTSRYQGILIKPGQIFSFGEYLGEVGPAQGYAESKVILEGRQEFQYGGGLCQVSSTMFRAALNAGLPIVQRTNHAFQVSYYTQPYGVPGVDATIYYPAVDLKFKNDTSRHILVQTELNGTTLHFRFYGTKEKEGRVRGPFFNFGSLDPNTPSQTTFYRDVVVNGQVAKTDTFTTYYKSALDFPTAN
jgi:vancomycin resistance protein YoaR